MSLASRYDFNSASNSSMYLSDLSKAFDNLLISFSQLASFDSRVETVILPYLKSNKDPEVKIQIEAIFPRL